MSSRPKRILLVEDDRDALILTTRMLESLGHSVVAFSSGIEAISNIKGENFDVALLDIMMIDMNGYELLVRIREMPMFKGLPIIFVTAKDKDSEVMEGYTSGAAYYITKPFTIKQLQYGINLVTE